MRKSAIFLAVASTLLILALAACGGGDGAGGNVDEGKALYESVLIGAQPGCITCHSLRPDEVLVGPSMAGIANRAGSRVSGVSAEDYLRQSITHPDEYVVEGFQPGVMVQVWEEELTPEQIDNLVAFLMTLQ